MYIQLVESNRNFKSPVLYIHSDEEEAIQFIENWMSSLVYWVARSSSSEPLARLDCNTAMVDLCYKLGAYYRETAHRDTFGVESWLRIYNEEFVSGENIRVITLETN